MAIERTFEGRGSGVADAVELKSEQTYFDDALEWRERQRQRLGEAPSAAANPKDAVGIRRNVNGALGGFRPPDESVAFGRIDIEDGEDVFYIGYHVISDGDNEPLVINWRTPIGERFYEASHEDPCGLVRRRQYTCRGNTILDFEDDLFADLVEKVARLREPGDLDDALLEDLERGRTGEMQDIVRTIRAAQHRIVRADLDQLLLVQGGPGTGKTAVALHRVSWLLFNVGDLDPSDVAVVGPNPTFIRYIRSVLPSLGDDDVRQLPLRALGPQVRLGRTESPNVEALKGEARMGRLLDRALMDRIGLPDGPLVVRVDSRPMQLERDRVRVEVDRLRDGAYSTGRQALRRFLHAELNARRTSRLDSEIRIDVVDSLLDRIWPQLTPPAFLQELLGSEARLLRAAGDEFTAREVRLLYRRSADRISQETWSDGDVPLLDHAAWRMGVLTNERFKHIVVDEAQDLSPMQLASIKRRALNGSMTVLGDLAQSTGHWARDSWDSVLDALSYADVDVNVTELEIGYRVPRQAFELAAQLLPVAAPGVTPPRVVRDGPDPIVRRVDDPDGRATCVADEATGYAGRGLLVGVICPGSLRDGLTHEFLERGVRWHNSSADGIGTGINLLSPEDAKGLEFDAVVVVEPEIIVREHERGDRLLYVALTRTTQHLSIVHAGMDLDGLAGASAPAADDDVDSAPTSIQPLVQPGDEVAGPPPSPTIPSPNLDTSSRPRVVRLLAADLAAEITGSLPEELWMDLLEELWNALDAAASKDTPDV